MFTVLRYGKVFNNVDFQLTISLGLLPPILQSFSTQDSYFKFKSVKHTSFFFNKAYSLNSSKLGIAFFSFLFSFFWLPKGFTKGLPKGLPLGLLFLPPSRPDLDNTSLSSQLGINKLSSFISIKPKLISLFSILFNSSNS